MPFSGIYAARGFAPLRRTKQRNAPCFSAPCQLYGKGMVDVERAILYRASSQRNIKRRKKKRKRWAFFLCFLEQHHAAKRDIWNAHVAVIASLLQRDGPTIQPTAFVHYCLSSILLAMGNIHGTKTRAAVLTNLGG